MTAANNSNIDSFAVLPFILHPKLFDHNIINRSHSLFDHNIINRSHSSLQRKELSGSKSPDWPTLLKGELGKIGPVGPQGPPVSAEYTREKL